MGSGRLATFMIRCRISNERGNGKCRQKLPNSNANHIMKYIMHKIFLDINPTIIRYNTY